MQLLLFSLIHQVSVPTFTQKFHSSAVTQYTITYTLVLNDLSLSEHMVEFFSMQQNLTYPHLMSNVPSMTTLTPLNFVI